MKNFAIAWVVILGEDPSMAFRIYLTWLVIKLVLLPGQGQTSYEVIVLKGNWHEIFEVRFYPGPMMTYSAILHTASNLL
jgi:hypothetical protein